jgi:phenylalanyl-tRNA synthetase beta chain
MRLPLSWLADHVEHGLDTDALADLLSGSGTLVEAVHHIGIDSSAENRESLRVGKVIAAERHPNADRLRVCRVDVGEDEPRQIVCGAPNVAVGQTVAVALPGALLPGAAKPLKAARLRGVESSGMICSATELRLGQDTAGIMVMDDGLDAGTPLLDALPGSETVLELEITSNRPDCLGIRGLAREVHAASGAPLAPLDESDPPAEGPGSVAEHVALDVSDPDLCPR